MTSKMKSSRTWLVHATEWAKNIRIRLCLETEPICFLWNLVFPRSIVKWKHLENNKLTIFNNELSFMKQLSSLCRQDKLNQFRYLLRPNNRVSKTEFGQFLDRIPNCKCLTIKYLKSWAALTTRWWILIPFVTALVNTQHSTATYILLKTTLISKNNLKLSLKLSICMRTTSAHKNISWIGMKNSKRT